MSKHGRDAISISLAITGAIVVNLCAVGHGKLQTVETENKYM